MCHRHAPRGQGRPVRALPVHPHHDVHEGRHHAGQPSRQADHRGHRPARRRSALHQRHRHALSGRGPHGGRHAPIPGRTLAQALAAHSRTSDCRIFQNQSVVQIADTLLSEGGITDYKKQGLSGSHPSRDYCVQYRETDYAFLQRIFAEEGIYFYFQYDSSSHTLVLSDSTAGYVDSISTSRSSTPPSPPARPSPCRNGRAASISGPARRS